MKRIIVLINILLVSVSVYAIQAPKTLTAAFQQKFVGAGNVKWEKENEKDYEAFFDMNGKKMSAIFNEQGQLLTTQTEIGLKGLPGIARMILQTRFIGWNISTAHKIDKPDGTSLFRANLDRRGTRKEVFLNKNGAIIK